MVEQFMTTQRKLTEEEHKANIEKYRSKYDRLTLTMLQEAYKLYLWCLIFYPVWQIADWIRTRYWYHPCEMYAIKYIWLDWIKNGLPTNPEFTYPPTWLFQNGAMPYERLRDQQSE
jgi:hypothetical protein